MYSTLKRCPGLLAWDKLGKRIALDTALGLNYLHSRSAPALTCDQTLFCWSCCIHTGSHLLHAPALD